MKKILVIDDSVFMCKTIESIYRSHPNTKVCYCIESQEAVEMMRKEKPDLVLLDVVFPKTTGFELLSHIKSYSSLKDTPIIFLTANDDKETIERCFNSGAVDYISKPFNEVELLARVQMHIDKCRTNKELELAMTELQKIVHVDHLTNLYNRRYFLNFLENLIPKSGTTFSIGLCDIDDFKKINDTYGHATGDDVLKTVSKLFGILLPSESIVARWGGEEFIFLFPDTSAEQAKKIGDLLCKGVSKHPFPFEEQIFSVSITVGIFEYDSRLSIDSNISLADKSLYYGKSQGKNQCNITKV